MLRSARHVRHSAVQSPLRWISFSAAALLAIILLLTSKAILAFFTRRRIAAYPEKSPQAAATLWYGRMTRSLARKGWQKSAAHTPEEFVHTIADPELRNAVASFTNHYENARFGESAEDAGKLAHGYEQISSICSR
jgi:hypothetical protein